MASTPLDDTFGGTGQSNEFESVGLRSISLSGTWVGTVVVQRKISDVWVDVATFTSNVERVGIEPRQGTLWRFNCTAYTSGTIVYYMGA